MSDSGPPVNGFGFAWLTDGEVVDGVDARARTLTLPYWFIVLLFLSTPLLWLRASRRQGPPRRAVQ